MKKFIAIFVVMLFAAGSAQAVLINNALRHTGYHKMVDTGTVASELHDMAFVITGPEPSRERFEPISFTYSTVTGSGTIAGILDARACGGPSEVYFEAPTPVPAIVDPNPVMTPAGAVGTITEATGSHNDQGKTVGIDWSGLGPVTLTGTAGSTTYTVDVELIFGPSGDKDYNNPDEDPLSSYDPLGEDYVYTWTIEISDDALAEHGGDAVSPGGGDNPRMAVYLAVGREEANGGCHRFTQVERQFQIGPDAYTNDDGTTGATKWSKFAAYQDLGIYYGWRDGSDIGDGSFQIYSIIFGGNLLVDTDNIIPEPGIIFVDADAAGGGDGSSWADAYNFLQDALADSAASGKKIFVAEGIYKPDQTTANPGGTGDRLATFQLINDVGVYGGFPSGGGTWDQRDPDAYETILSGDLNGDDGPDFANNGENSYHVVTGSGTDPNTILDGFTITAGNANGSSPHDCGGGMYNNNSSPTVTNCMFSGNIAAYGGGGMGNVSSSPIVTNCTFSGNTALYGGGGMGNESNSNPIVTNCTFSGNTALYGGGMGNVSSSPMVTNCILWGDTPEEIYDDVTSTTTVNYSDVQGDPVYPGTGNINVDPRFADANNPDPNLWNLRLSYDSPCVDAGDNSAPNLPPTDLAGNPRIVDGDRNGTATVDMGAYEYQSRLIHNITQDNWYETIQAAIDASSAGDEIEVAPGTYNESINFNDKAVRLYSSGGPEVTTIDGDGAYHVVQCVSGEDANTILEGFTITDGNANGTNPNDRGAGMYNNNSSPVVTNCTLSGNTALYGGGGMGNVSSSPMVTNCTFSNNIADSNGGGMYNYASNPIVTNCTFSGNTASNSGGGMGNVSSSPMVTNCILWGNIAPTGPGIYGGSPTVTYCNVQDGTAQSWFGAGCIDADPCFVDANHPDPNLVNLRLKPGSPCIDAGDNTAVPASVLKDLAGKLRYADDPCTPDTGNAGMTGRPVVDMGAYEFQASATTSQNLLANPGFEVGDATGWVTNWGFDLTADTNEVHDGNYSGLASVRTASWQGAWQSLLGLMDDGKTYRISGWVRLQNADSNYVALTVKKTDSAGTNYYGIDNATGYDNQWVHLDGTLALDIIGQPTELFVYFEGPAPGVNFYVDDAAVTEVMGDMNHNGGVDFIDFSLFASYYGFDCSTQDCGRANLDDCDNTINELDLLIFCNNWLIGTEP